MDTKMLVKYYEFLLFIIADIDYFLR